MNGITVAAAGGHGALASAIGLMSTTATGIPSSSRCQNRRNRSHWQRSSGPAVRLFVDRAAAVQPRFMLTERNAATVVHVCRRLDGIPLALEIAAVRIEALTVAQVAARLDQRFCLLTGGSRTALPRQRTLRATLDWSYELLSEPERRLLSRLSVFAGGWTLEAAQAVCAGDTIQSGDVVEWPIRLVRASLVVSEEGRDAAARYRLPETLRQYAHERLVAAGEEQTVNERHAGYYLALAEQVGPSMYEWAAVAVDWLLTEHDNFRAAGRWFSESNAVERAVRRGGELCGVRVFGGYSSKAAPNWILCWRCHRGLVHRETERGWSTRMVLSSTF